MAGKTLSQKLQRNPNLILYRFGRNIHEFCNFLVTHLMHATQQEDLLALGG